MSHPHHPYGHQPHAPHHPGAQAHDPDAAQAPGANAHPAASAPVPNPYAGQASTNPYAGQPAAQAPVGQPSAHPYPAGHHAVNAHAGQQANPHRGQAPASPYAGQQAPNAYGGQANPHMGQQASAHPGQQVNAYGGQANNPYAEQQVNACGGQVNAYAGHQANPYAGQGSSPYAGHPSTHSAAAPITNHESVDDSMFDGSARDASPAMRAKFIERTYMHLAGAIIVFVMLTAGLQHVPGVEKLVGLMTFSRFSWAIVLAAFMVVSWVADFAARRSTSLAAQYAGLTLYTVAEAVIFVPLIYFARQIVGVEGIMLAGGLTMAMFSALTAYVLITKKDFSWMKGGLVVMSTAAMALIVGSLIWGFDLGLVFSVGMIVLMGGYILYYTSAVLREYRTTQYVAAALALFAALSTLFWYVLRLLMRLRE